MIVVFVFRLDSDIITGIQTFAKKTYDMILFTTYIGAMLCRPTLAKLEMTTLIVLP